MTPLFLLNFLVLQWFGVRLKKTEYRALALRRPVRVEWRLLRWIWPLTGWISEYRWIGRRQ